MSLIVQSDDACEMYLLALTAWFTGGPSLWLRMYSNDIPLSPDRQNPLNYVEATYPGYVQLATLGTWSAPVRDSAGIWHVQSGPWQWGDNAGAADVTMYGWYLVRGARVIFARRFDAPIIIGAGGPAPRLLIRLTQASQSAICTGD
jgi:hypothetical protein